MDTDQKKWVAGLAILTVTGVVASILLLPASDRGDSEMRKQREDWNQFCERFISQDGRVVDDVNGNISHSEGQGYALVISTYMDDPETFDRVWAWTRNHLQIRGEDHLLAWRWEATEGSDAPGRVTDINNASDGDILVAWGLCLAYQRWKDQEHLIEARKICQAIREKAVRSSRYGTVLVPGVYGFDHPDGVVVNLSYWVFPAFRKLSEIDPEGDFWIDLSDVGKRLLSAATFGEHRLPPDWLKVSQPLRPADDFEPVFGYNAIRIPLHLAWVVKEDSEALPLLEPYLPLNSESTEALPARIAVSGAPVDAEAALPGMKDIFGLAESMVRGTSPDFREGIDVDSGYYSSVLQLLTRCAFHETTHQHQLQATDSLPAGSPNSRSGIFAGAF